MTTLLFVAQGRECLQVSQCEAVAQQAAWRCVEEAASVEEQLAEEVQCPEEQDEEG